MMTTSDGSPATRGLSRPRRALLAVLVGVALVVSAWWLALAPEGVVAALTALDDGTAAIVLQAGTRSWLARLGADGRLLTWRDLDGSYATWSGGPGIVVVGDALHVRVLRGGRASVVAFAREDLAPRWRTDLGESTIIADEGPLTLASGLLLAQLEEDASVSIVALSPQNGEIVWRRTLAGATEGMLGPPFVAGDRLVFSQDSNVWVLRASDGAPLRTLRAYTACVGARGEIWANVDGSLVALADDPEGDRVILRESEMPEGTFGNCSERDAMPFVLATRGGVGSWVAGGEGDAAWSVALEGDLAYLPTDQHFRGHTPATMPATRVLPLVIDVRPDAEGVSRYGLALIDLDARRATVRHGIAGYPVSPIATVDGRVYVAPRSYFEGSIDVLDGETGAVLASARVAPSYAFPMTPMAIAGGRLWRIGVDRRRLDALDVAVLDAATLRPIAVQGAMRVTDVSDEARQRWPAPPR